MYGIYNVNTVNVQIFKVKNFCFFNQNAKNLNFFCKKFILSMASGLQDLCK